jgi:hypothetical protein
MAQSENVWRFQYLAGGDIRWAAPDEKKFDFLLLDEALREQQVDLATIDFDRLAAEYYKVQWWEDGDLLHVTLVVPGLPADNPEECDT